MTFNTIGLSEQDISIGRNVRIEDNVRFIGIDGEKARIDIGDNVFIGHDVKICGGRVTIKDYSVIHNHTFIYAKKPVSIGFNAWIGQNCILNGDAALTIGNNVGVGAYSQLWTHIKFGDVLEGCRFHSYKEMVVGDDVWFVGRCLVSPIIAEPKSMALAGSVIVRDMKRNRVYAGVPAVDVTERAGPQFQPVSIDEKYAAMKKHLFDFYHVSGEKDQDEIVIVKQFPDDLDPSKTYFNVGSRTYTKTGSRIEQAFMKHLLPEKAKFTPERPGQ